MPEMAQFLELLTWALPPVIGALIGYITNDIAIKMLFRPLRAMYIGPWRLPFTPGIIPRQRERLAESIGVMVSRELITEDALRGQISSETFQRTLSLRIRELSTLVLSTPMNELSARFKGKRDPSQSAAGNGPARNVTEGNVPVDTLLVQDILSSFFRSGAFFNGLQSSLSLALDSFFQLKVKTLAGREGSRLVTFFKMNVNLGGLREPLRKLANDLVEEGIRKSAPLDRVLSPPAIEGITRGIDRLYPSLARELLVFLRTPHIHSTLEQKGRTVLRRLISRMSSLQRIFLVAGQYNRNIEEQMDEIVDDALEQLETAITDEVTRRKVLETITSWLRQLSSHTLADIAGIWGKSLPSDVGRGVDGLFDMMQSPRVSEWGRALLSRLLGEYGDTCIGELLTSLTGMERRELSEVLADWVGTLIRTAETESNTTLHFFRQLISALSDDGKRSIATIIRLEEEHKVRLDSLLEQFVLGMIDTHVPIILESVDVNTLVVEKINSLDIEKVEELILIVIKTHLRYIIFFGAVLGFFIGSLQVLLTKVL